MRSITLKEGEYATVTLPTGNALIVHATGAIEVVTEATCKACGRQVGTRADGCYRVHQTLGGPRCPNSGKVPE